MADTLPPSVHTVVLATGDVSGILRGKRVQASLWDNVAERGVALANAIFTMDMTCDIWDTPYGNMDNGYPDVFIKPIPGAVRTVPWNDGTVLVMCEAHEEDGSPVPVDPRNALKDAIAKAEAMGFNAKIGTEFEFYLLDPESRQPIDKGIQVYGIARGAKYEHVMAPIRNHLAGFGIVVEVSNPEYAPSQFEVNIRYTDALLAADNAVLFRNAVKEIADQHGLLATFMAKPFDAESGNGFHVHQSLWDGDQNVFAAGGKLSQIGRHYLGGLRRHMGPLTLLGAPNPNSFRRRQPYTFCPINNSWGGDNRTVGIRVIEGHDDAVRIEQRDASADANPYLTIAGQIQAGLQGIETEADPGPMCEGDGYAAEGYEPLPANVPAAVAALRGSALAQEVFNPMLLEIITGMAEREQEFVTGVVSPVERERYLEAY